MKKFNKQQAHELLLSHEFVQGWTANTADWYTKNNQEIRITENGFSHWKYKIDKFHPTNFINSNLAQLENTIFQFRLNEKLIRRNYSLYPTFSPEE
jgi:hypothetical protein